MPIPLAHAVLKEAWAMGARACEFSGGGEPMMHPQFAEVVEYAAALGFRVGIITNGALLGRPGIVDVVARYATWLRVSLDAATPHTYRLVHGSQADLQPVLNSIADLLAVRRSVKTRLRVGVKFLLSKTNVSEHGLAIDLAERIGVDYIYFKAAIRCPQELTVSEKRTAFAQIETAMSRHVTGCLKVGGYCRWGNEFPRCLLTPLHAIVDWDGSLYVCPFFPHRRKTHCIGNVNDGGLVAHWGSPVHKARIASIKPEECNPDCPLAKFDPVIEFIRQQYDLFSFF
jgi:radical SAM protein with 4Fe4S-binding SPASM domain